MGKGMMHSSGTVTKVTKAAGGKNKGVFRLEEIEVEEVSLVDHAANKRSFIVVKRSDQMGAEVKPDGKGGLTAASKTVSKASVEVPPGFKEMVTPIITKAVEKLGILADMVKGASVADVSDEGDLPGVPNEFVTGVQSIMALLDKASTMFPAAPPSVDPAAEGATEEAPSELQMRATMDNLAKVFGNPKVEKSAVAKVGAKMSKERLTRFDQAMTVLAGLRNELAASEQAAAGAAPGEAAKGKTSKSDEALAAKIEALADTVAKGFEKVGAVVKGQNAKIETMASARGAGNGNSSVEQPVTKARGNADGNVSWPLDMNKPVSKDNVEKATSFFDE